MNVKKLVRLMGFGTIAILLLAGCASTHEPDMSAYKPRLKPVRVEGKLYLIPKNSYNYEKLTNKNYAKYFSTKDRKCRVGDVSWYTKKGHEVLSHILNKPSSDTKEQELQLGIIAAVLSGNGGCVRPSTAKQKQAYLRELDQKQAMIISELNYRQSQKPIRYEVHHTGDIGVYHY